jgi:hypothetical protein
MKEIVFPRILVRDIGISVAWSFCTSPRRWEVVNSDENSEEKETQKQDNL